MKVLIEPKNKKVQGKRKSNGTCYLDQDMC